MPEDLHDFWTPKHDAEMAFNRQKQKVGIFEALRSGSVKQAEVPDEILKEAALHFEKRSTTW